MKFGLRVESFLGFPVVGPDYLDYAPPADITIHNGELIYVPTLITVEHCEQGGAVHIEIVDALKSFIKISNNVCRYGSLSNDPVVVLIQNVSGDTIQVTRSDKLFRFIYVDEHVQRVAKEEEVATSVEEAKEEEVATSVEEAKEEAPKKKRAYTRRKPAAL